MTKISSNLLRTAAIGLITALFLGGCTSTDKPAEKPAPSEKDTAVEEVEEVEVQSGDTYRSTLSENNFTFSIPEGAVATQADAGGASAVMVKQDGELIYTVTISAVEKSETTAFTFRDWLEGQGRSLTGHTGKVGGFTFYEASEGSEDTVAHHHYVDAAPGEQAYVITIPVLSEGDSAGEYIQNSLNFEPTEEELDAAQPVG